MRVHSTWCYTAILASMLALAGCGGGDSCHVGIWKLAAPHGNPACTDVRYLHLRADGRLLSLNTIQCALDGQQQLYVWDSEPYQRAYSVSGTDFILEDDSEYWGSFGVLACEGDLLTIAGNYHDGIWSRLVDTERDAAADVFGLKCHPSWHSCVGQFFGELPCQSDANCPFSSCWIDEGICDAP